MSSNRQKLTRASGGLLLIGAVACIAAAGCSDIRPEPNVEQGGVLDSPTHEADSMREEEQQQREGRR